MNLLNVRFVKLNNTDNENNVIDESKPKNKLIDKKKNLRNWNIAMSLIHGISFLLIYILVTVYYDRVTSVHFGVYSDFPVATSGMQFAPALKLISNYNLIWILVFFPLITSFFHGLLATFVFDTYYTNVMKKGINIYRWIEYSITAGLMTWVIFALSGGTNIFIATCLLVLNINMNVFGYYSELLNSTKNPTSTTKNDENQSNRTEMLENTWRNKFRKYYKTYSNDNDTIDWWPIIFGFLNFIIIWIIILTYFFEAITSSTNSIPWWVYTIDIGLFFQFLLFGLVMVFHYMAKSYILYYSQANRPIKNNYTNMNEMMILFLGDRYNYEIQYQILSLTSKLFLTWFLFSGFFTT